MVITATCGLEQLDKPTTKTSQFVTSNHGHQNTCVCLLKVTGDLSSQLAEIKLKEW